MFTLVKRADINYNSKKFLSKIYKYKKCKLIIRNREEEYGFTHGVRCWFYNS